MLTPILFSFSEMCCQLWQ